MMQCWRDVAIDKLAAYKDSVPPIAIRMHAVHHDRDVLPGDVGGAFGSDLWRRKIVLRWGTLRVH
jgi:hypothetical protein